MIVLEVYVPSVEGSFDFEVAESILVADFIEKVSDIVSRKIGSDTGFEEDKAMVFDYVGERPLDKKVTLKENGITDGSKLIVV